MDTKTRKICNDYYTCEKQTGQNFLVTLRYYKREERENVPDIFLLAPVTNTILWTLNGEDLRVAIVLNVQKHGGEFWTAMKYNTKTVFKFFMLHVLSVFTLCHVRAKNLPRLSIYGYRFVFSLQGCARFWLQARELDDFLFFEAISTSTYPGWHKRR